MHGRGLADEYTVRFGKRHAAASVIESAIDICGIEPSVYTPSAWPMAMPTLYKRRDPHVAYRLYLTAKYSEWREKGGIYTPRWRAVAEDNPFV